MTVRGRLPMPDPIDRAYCAMRNFTLRCWLFGHREKPDWGTVEHAYCTRCHMTQRRETDVHRLRVKLRLLWVITWAAFAVGALWIAGFIVLLLTRAWFLPSTDVFGMALGCVFVAVSVTMAHSTVRCSRRWLEPIELSEDLAASRLGISVGTLHARQARGIAPELTDVAVDDHLAEVYARRRKLHGQFARIAADIEEDS